MLFDRVCYRERDAIAVCVELHGMCAWLVATSRRAFRWPMRNWSQTLLALSGWSVIHSAREVVRKPWLLEYACVRKLTVWPLKLPVRRSSRFIIMRSQSSSECRIGYPRKTQRQPYPRHARVRKGGAYLAIFGQSTNDVVSGTGDAEHDDHHACAHSASEGESKSQEVRSESNGREQRLAQRTHVKDSLEGNRHVGV